MDIIRQSRMRLGNVVALPDDSLYTCTAIGGGANTPTEARVRFSAVTIHGLFSYMDRVWMKTDWNGAYSFREGDFYGFTDEFVNVYLPPSKPVVGRFIYIKAAVMRGSDRICTARTTVMARRIANALNRYTPNSKGY